MKEFFAKNLAQGELHPREGSFLLSVFLSFSSRARGDDKNVNLLPYGRSVAQGSGGAVESEASALWAAEGRRAELRQEEARAEERCNKI